MVVKNPLSRGLGNITKFYLITWGQSTCSKLKKYEFCMELYLGVSAKQINIIFLHIKILG